MKPLCIFHANCLDGIAAAAAVYQHYKDAGGVDFFPAHYDKPPPIVSDRDVIMVDFSYKRPVLLKMAEEATSITILDHHKSAQEELVDLPDNVAATFDMNRSGAKMAWDVFMPNMRTPRLVEHIEDRDLWRFSLMHTRAITAALFSGNFVIEDWADMLTDPLEDEKVRQGTTNLIIEGRAIERARFVQYDKILEGTHRMVIDWVEVPAVNAPPSMASDLGHMLIQQQRAEGRFGTFAVVYSRVGEKTVYNLRSADDGMDVQAIAARFGGGGHRNAAGFTTDVYGALQLFSLPS